jgi:hypothetical protein
LQAAARLKEVNQELARLPPAVRPEERGARAYDWLQKVAHDMVATIEGRSERGKAFTREVNDILAAFKT